MTIWETLGLAPGADRDAIRRAYAKKLRVTNPEDDAEGFKVLRAAYEMALHYADNAAAWADEDDDEQAQDEQEALPFADPQFRTTPLDVATPDPAPPPGTGPQFRTEPATEAPPADVADLLAAREAEIADLNHLLGTLDAALRGPWQGDDRAVAETFASLLRAPAMGEIRVAADVEQWVAGLLAATIPRSDVILAEAISAFGWADERRSNLGPAIGAVLARLDEWRLIEGLNRDSHPLHPAWKSLTRPAGAYWSWRLDAFRPGMESGVATLLGARGPVSPGLEYSFKADSVERWRRFLDAPHATLGMLAAIPLTLLLWLFAMDAFGDPAPAIAPWADYAIGAAVLISPLAPFLARLLRARWLRTPHPAWLAQGWVGGLAIVFVAAMLLPRSRPALAALFVAGAAAWLWMAVAGGSATIEEVRARLRAGWLTAIGCTLLGLGAALSLDSVHRAALTLVVALGATVMVGPLTQGATPLARVRWWRTVYAVAVVAGIAGVAYGAAPLSMRPLPALFYAGGLTLVGGMIVAAAARIAGLRGVAEQRTLRFLKIALVGLFLFGAFAVIGDQKPARRATVQSSSVSLAADDDSLDNRVLAALDASDDTESALTQLQQRIPGFAQIARGNPELMETIRKIVGRDFVNLRNDRATADALSLVLSDSYVKRLPLTSDAQLGDEIDIRRARLRALRDESAEACLRPRQIDEPGLPAFVRNRQVAQMFNVLSNPISPPEERFNVAPYSDAEFTQLLIAQTDLPAPKLEQALQGKAGAAAECDARIAVLTVLAHASERGHALAMMRAMASSELARARNTASAYPPNM